MGSPSLPHISQAIPLPSSSLVHIYFIGYWIPDTSTELWFPFLSTITHIPGAIAMVEILHDPRGNTIFYCAWGLGNISNNLVEVYSLWFGISIDKEEGVRSLSVFGDSMLFIREMIGQFNLEGYKLKILLSKIKQDLSLFERISFFHIKNVSNEEIDH